MFSKEVSKFVLFNFLFQTKGDQTVQLLNLILLLDSFLSAIDVLYGRFEMYSSFNNLICASDAVVHPKSYLSFAKTDLYLSMMSRILSLLSSILSKLASNSSILMCQLLKFTSNSQLIFGKNRFSFWINRNALIASNPRKKLYAKFSFLLLHRRLRIFAIPPILSFTSILALKKLLEIIYKSLLQQTATSTNQ